MQVILRGLDHPDLGVVESRSPAPDLAVALTRGRFVKSYRYTDPNEDVVAVCRRYGRTAMIVADGHNGHEASHTAVHHLLWLLDQEIPVWTKVEAVRAFHAINERIRDVRRGLPADHRGSRTTLALAAIVVDEARQRFLIHCAVGDSAVLVVRGGEVHQLTQDRQYFMGDALTPPLVAGALDYDKTALEPTDVVVVVSDGYTNFAPIREITRAVEASANPENVARHIIRIAGDGGAGDNVAVAVLGSATTATDRSTAHGHP